MIIISCRFVAVIRRLLAWEVQRLVSNTWSVLLFEVVKNIKSRDNNKANAPEVLHKNSCSVGIVMTVLVNCEVIHKAS